MTEDKNGVKNGEANSPKTEMAPQEDGTKVPLTNNDGAMSEVKYMPDNAATDAKVDMGHVPTFNGLTKEDLMKYSDDPFWTKLRWFLFILFWAGWLLMLIGAIVIIVQTPACAPKETLEWVQESAMVDYNINNQVDADADGTATPEDLIAVAKGLGIKTVYLSDLISPLDFNEINGQYKPEDVLALLKAAKENDLNVVTDFVPLQVAPDNVWLKNENMSDFFKPGSGELNFENEGLLEALKDVFQGSWIAEKGVKGFIMESSTKALEKAQEYFNTALDAEDGLVVSGVADMKKELVSGFNADMYRKFLLEHENAWSYFKYNPNVAEDSIPDVVHLVTMSLFLVPGTPILDGFDRDYFNNEKETIVQLSKLRERESVQIGKIVYANETANDVIAFARVLKGTPGYAIAINMHENNSTSVDFSKIEGVPEKGEVHLVSTNNGTMLNSGADKKDLSNVEVGPLEGVILQFVPSF